MITALITFGVDVSPDYERVHLHSLVSNAKLLCYAMREVQIERDADEISGLPGFARQR